MITEVIAEVESQCKERRVPMLGREKAEYLAALVTEKQPGLIVECGTAIGYSGLWMASRLGKDSRIITLEIDEDRAREAQSNFERADVREVIDSRIGNAVDLVKEIAEPVDFLLLDNNYGNYMPCFQGISSWLKDGATVVADNVGIGADGMADYLDRVRSRYDSKTVWFDVDLPWVKKDAMEVTVFQR
ncbi:MAG: class I SAM-dependent methyltransferase [Candidatus Latescibacteria bacterium]|nr:class I SAM-dependent methyltransferase [Candidatus Latescibacterota bacterium]